MGTLYNWLIKSYKKYKKFKFIIGLISGISNDKRVRDSAWGPGEGGWHAEGDDLRGDKSGRGGHEKAWDRTIDSQVHKGVLW
jgi:hypothetical protein